MSVDIVLSKITVLPKNSVVKSKVMNGNTFYNIRTNKIEDGYYTKWRDGKFKSIHCSWFEELGNDYYVVTDDTMYINYISDVSQPRDGYCTAIEMLNEGLDSSIKSDYEEVWKIVEPDFDKFLKERIFTKMSLPYLLDINVHSTYCSYAGDGDVYLNITAVSKVTGNVINKSEIKHKFDEWMFSL